MTDDRDHLHATCTSSCFKKENVMSNSTISRIEETLVRNSKKQSADQISKENSKITRGNRYKNVFTSIEQSNNYEIEQKNYHKRNCYVDLDNRNQTSTSGYNYIDTFSEEQPIHNYKNSISGKCSTPELINDSSFRQPDLMNKNMVIETDYGNKWMKTENSQDQNKITAPDCICKSTPRLNQDILLRNGFDTNSEGNFGQQTCDFSDESKNRMSFSKNAFSNFNSPTANNFYLNSKDTPDPYRNAKRVQLMNKSTVASINKSNQSCLVGKIHRNQLKTTKSENTQNSLKIFSSTGVKTINLFSKCTRNSQAKSQISKEDHAHQMRELNNLRSSKKT